MPNRKVPESGKAKKLKLQAARAAKSAQAAAIAQAANIANDDGVATADFATPALDKSVQRKPAQRKPVQQHGRRYHAMSLEERQQLTALQNSKKGLESKFIKLPAAYVEHYERVLSQQPFPRPLGPNAGILQDESDHIDLALPRRPRWRHTMSKKEVESNEEAMFKRWLAETESKLAVTAIHADHLPGFYERNLNVYRQLWRVTEASDIVLVLLDVRCPFLPRSLRHFLATLKPKKSCVIVLTKADLVPQAYVDAWKTYLSNCYELSVASIHSYTERPESEQKTRSRYIPGTGCDVRSAFVETIRMAHEQLCTPPDRIAGDVEKLARWRPRVRSDIDWNALQRGAMDNSGSTEADNGTHGDDDISDTEQAESAADEEEASPSIEPAFLSVGLIGQPNVGKSSLLNALVGKHVVRASRTPGKTKALQTIFWTPEVRLVDCPGIVFPSTRSVSQQVLGGVIPIQNVECVIHDIAELMPLEEALNMTSAKPVCTDRLLSDYATAKSYLTAKAARPDLYRAGSVIIRALQSSAIPWAFRPPVQEALPGQGASSGIWLSNTASYASLKAEDTDSDNDSRSSTASDMDAHSRTHGVAHNSHGTTDEDHEEEPAIIVSTSKFALLDVEDDDEINSDSGSQCSTE